MGHGDAVETNWGQFENFSLKRFHDDGSSSESEPCFT